MPYLDSSQRGALALGALLAFVLLVTVAGAFRIYHQLAEAAGEQRLLVRAQEQLYGVLRAQYDEENGVRGYVATRREYFLGNRVSARDEFDQTIDDFERTTRRLGTPALTASARNMADVHRRWERTVAEPLSVYPLPRNAPRVLATGKVLADQIRADAGAVGLRLDMQLTQAQRSLVWRINQTLGVAVVAIVLFGILGIIFVGSRRRMQARLERERRIIEVLQRAFRTDWETLPKSRVGSAYVSATRDASVGGDLFDVHRLDRDHGLIVVADVSGKGIEAAVNTAFVKYSIRTLALGERDPAKILDAFNVLFLDSIKDPGLFVVAFVGVLDAATMQLHYASAGHAGAFLRRGADVLQLGVTGPIVGLDRSFTYTSETVGLRAGDLLVLATDGLTDARDRHGKTLDETGAMRLLKESPRDPQACADQLVSAVQRRSGGRIFDDLALLVIGIEEAGQERPETARDAAA
ncbi:MAG: SpoIIE family protein phosphatase [Candidatus Eremiobacteraeota bacterium]|nr:SpoIIE family protein phosphatase [Candidatus Eremiobacteraeota bacterium]